jgi:hypothetical protein
MPELITPERAAVLALLVLVLEGLGLLLHHRLTGRGIPTSAIISMLLPGALLMGALLSAIASGSTASMLVIMAFALAAHVNDVRRRMKDYAPSSEENRGLIYRGTGRSTGPGP